MTYEDYKGFGGVCPEAQFASAKVSAEIQLSNLERTYCVKYPCLESRDLVLTKMIDLEYEDVQTQGGTLVSMKSGSYSEQRKAEAQSERRLKPFFILKKYADVSAERVGVIS